MGPRITTRRARACAPSIRLPLDIEIANFTTDDVAIAMTVKVEPDSAITLACTVVDVGDPKFRLWLYALATTARAADASIMIDLVLGPDPEDEDK